MYGVGGCRLQEEGGDGQVQNILSLSSLVKERDFFLIASIRKMLTKVKRDFPGGKDSACQCRRHRFDPWVGKIAWSWRWQSTPVFLPEKSHGQEPGGPQSMGRQSQTWLGEHAMKAKS